jgi:hypothetical protein
MFTTKRNNLVAKGGIMQEGGTVDEASGNEVPPGSLKEEVRDDVDAKLSVGEYVFPADVTRYYGLAKLEEMRKEAQANLKQMENGGRMGNSEQVSEEASDEYDDKEFSGAVDQAMQEQDGENGYAEGGMVKSYDVGGAVTYDPAVSKETYKRAPLKGFEMIPMSDDKGNTIYIPFINGKPQLNIPPGFAIRAAAPKAETPVTDSTTPTAPAADQPRGGGGDRAGMSQTQRDSFDSESAADRDARMSSISEGFGSAVNAGAKLGLFGPLGVAASAIYGGLSEAATDPNSALGPYGFGYTTDSGPNARLAVVKQAIQLAVDKNISPNDALSSILSNSDLSSAISGQDAANARDSVDTGVTVGPAISTPNTSPTALGPVAAGGAAGTSEGGYSVGSQAASTAASGTVSGYGPGTPGFNDGGGRSGGGEGGGAATGGQGGDASGGGDRGTRGGFAKGGLVSRRNK